MSVYNGFERSDYVTFKKAPKNINEIKKRVEKYFSSRLQPMTDKNGNVILDENGEIINKVSLPYTLTGLALAVGLESREELFSFTDPEINRFLRMSAMKVEEYAEERLFSRGIRTLGFQEADLTERRLYFTASINGRMHLGYRGEEGIFLPRDGSIYLYQSIYMSFISEAL
jgi:hypothetical protein